MIINHQHQFCFFAVPRTGSKAISQVLIDDLGSQSILKMHASYDEFIEGSSLKEQGYFTFATVRNPLDSAVSAYFKKKSDHNGRFSRGFFGDGRPVGERAMKEYQFITANNATFAEYLLRFYSDPYCVPRHEATIEQVDTVLRYEKLEEDFSSLLASRNLPICPLPQINKTKGKDERFLAYYSPEATVRAREVFGRLMDKWGYDFPQTWD